MFFLLFLFSTLGYPGSPGDADMSITVKAFKGAAIFIENPIINSEGKTYQSSELEFLLTSFAILHKDTYTRDKLVVSNVYNSHTAFYLDPECDWLGSSRQCAVKNDMHILSTQITVNPVRAYISVNLYDPEMNGIASATVSNKHQRHVIQLTKETQSQGLLGNTTTTKDDQMPQIFNIEPYLYEKDFRQAIILMYSSIR